MEGTVAYHSEGSQHVFQTAPIAQIILILRAFLNLSIILDNYIFHTGMYRFGIISLANFVKIT